MMSSGSTDGPLATPQVSLEKRLKMFSHDGLAAVKMEMQQLHDRTVMKPWTSKELKPHQKCIALAYLMLLKCKRCGWVKGHGCADGHKQHPYVAREHATSLTVASEAVFLMAVIDAWEAQAVAVVDLPGAFMQVDMDELLHVRLTEDMV